MRIDRLELRRFGRFTDVAIDLAQRATASGAEGLHVVHGPNEAGKSTALRALGDVLFDYPVRSTDDFLHEKSELRLGATLRARDGRVLAFVRRKSSKQPLWDASESTPLGSDALTPFLHGLDRDEFERVFGLDHVRLRSAADALLEPGDGATAAIVGSGLGIPDLRSVLDALRSEAEAMWSPRARNRPINEQQKRLAAAEKELRELAMPGNRWQSLRETLREAERRLAEARAGEATFVARREALARIARVREAVTTRRAARELLPSGIVIPPLDESFTTRREALDRKLAKLSGALASARLRLDDLRKQLADATRPEDLLPFATEIAALGAEDATTKKALADLVALEQELARRRVERDRLAAALGIGIDEASLAALRASLRRHAEDPSLARAVKDAQKLGDPSLDALDREQKRTELARERRTLTEQLESRSSHALGLEAFDALVLPDQDFLDGLRQQLARCDDELRQLERRRLELEVAETRLLAALESIRSEGRLPSDGALPEARRVRDELWHLARRAWLHVDDVAGLAAALDGERALPDAVEHAMRHADRVVDTLRAEAARLAALAASTRELEDNRHEQRLTRERCGALTAERRALADAWDAAWRELGLVPPAPGRERELRTLKSDVTELLLRERALERDQEKRQAQIETARTALLRALDAAPTLGFTALLELAEAELARVQGGEKLRAEHEACADRAQRIDAIRRDAADFTARAHALAARVAPELLDRQPSAIGAELTRRLAEQRRAETQRATLDEQVKKQLGDLRECEGELAAATEEQAALGREAGVADPTLLGTAEILARAERELRREGAPDELERLVDGHSALDLAAALATLDGPLRDAKANVESCTTTWLERRREFEAVDGTPHAARKAEELAALRAGLRLSIERHLCSALAARLLGAGLERYRELHAAPVLAFASRHLAGLTRGRYTTVTTDLDEAGRTFVRVRAAADRRPLTAGQLSDGTRDQLCLALVLGSLEHRSRHTEAMPLVLDDVLVHFDDERSLAALEVLAEFSASTQVLLFTHHGRIREQAAALGAARGVFIHHLGT